MNSALDSFGRLIMAQDCIVLYSLKCAATQVSSYEPHSILYGDSPHFTEVEIRLGINALYRP